MDIICRKCGKEYDVPVTEEQFNNWDSGMLIQRAMPHLTSDQRELVMSGTCGPCFDAIFPVEMRATH